MRDRKMDYYNQETARQNQLVIISVVRRLEHQVEEKQKQDDGPAGENYTSDPGSLHLAMVKTRDDDLVGMLNSPRKHARITVARAVEFGKLEHAHEGDPEGVTTRGKRRQPAQECGETFGKVDGVESGTWDVTMVVPHFGVMSEVTGK